MTDCCRCGEGDKFNTGLIATGIGVAVVGAAAVCVETNRALPELYAISWVICNDLAWRSSELGRLVRLTSLTELWTISRIPCARSVWLSVNGHQ